MIDLTGPVQITDDLWWVGTKNTHKKLQCNPYLFVHENSGVLFDPGSTLDGQEVLRKVQSLIPIENLEAIVLSHQDPDLCTAIPFFEEAGFKGVLCCHERASLIIQYYGFSSPFYPVNHHSFSYVTKTGKAIGFIFAPYLHFPGAIMSYLPLQQVLISGDVFGSITADWQLYADEHYLDGMIAFHEEYMPSHEILASTMQNLKSYPIKMICPQHGSVINNDIERYINTLENLRCGLFVESTKKDLPKQGGVRLLLDQLIKRLITIFGSDQIKMLFKDSPFTVDMRKKQITKTTVANEELWETFFSFLEERKGVSFLSAIAPLSERLSNDYDIPLPATFSSLLFAKQQEIEERKSELQEIHKKLFSLQRSLYLDTTTNLYNQEFYQVYLERELSDVLKKNSRLEVLVVSIDNLERINLDHGNQEGDKTMLLLGQLLASQELQHSVICRLSGGVFALVYTAIPLEETVVRATNLRNIIAQDERFITPISVSIGIYGSDELPKSIRADIPQCASVITQSALFRLRLAKKQGTGAIISSSTSQASSKSALTVVVVDNPGFDRDLIVQALKREQYRVLVADNGLAAKELILQSHPDLILCELLIGKLSGLTLRKELLKQTNFGVIPFVLMSINKNEQTITRAFELQIKHFLKRPVARFELVGLINLLMRMGG